MDESEFITAIYKQAKTPKPLKNLDKIENWIFTGLMRILGGNTH